MSKRKVIFQNNRYELIDAGELSAYIEDDILFGIDKAGYSQPIGPINHRVEIIGKYDKWIVSNR